MGRVGICLSCGNELKLKKLFGLFKKMKYCKFCMEWKNKDKTQF